MPMIKPDTALGHESEADQRDLLRQHEIQRQVAYMNVTSLGGINTIADLHNRIVDLIHWKLENEITPMRYQELNRRFAATAKRLDTNLRDEINKLISEERLMLLPEAMGLERKLIVTCKWYKQVREDFSDSDEFANAMKGLADRIN